MSADEPVGAEIQEDDQDSGFLPLKRSIVKVHDHEEIPDVDFSDPLNTMSTAQEMVKAVIQARPEHALEKVEECGLSPEEIEALREEQQAVLDDMASKMADIQAHQKNREAQEIAEEAMGNWDEELS